MEAVTSTPQQRGKHARARWPSRSAFIIASVGSLVGLGNVWRFPYLSFKHGGGAFLIPYVVFLLLVALPLVQTELALGARLYTSRYCSPDVHGRHGLEHICRQMLFMSKLGTYVRVCTWFTPDLPMRCKVLYAFDIRMRPQT